MGVVARACLIGPEGAPVAQKIWRDLRKAIQKRWAYAGEQDDLLRGLCKAQPETMLNALIAGNDRDRQQSVAIIHDTMRHRESPLSAIPDEVVLCWCEASPKTRYPFAAAVVLLFSRSNQNEPHEWRPIAAALLKRALDPVAVFKEIALRLRPTSFSGSVASKFESRLKLLDELEIGENPGVQAAFIEARAELAAKVERERRAEAEEGKVQSGRFE